MISIGDESQGFVKLLSFDTEKSEHKTVGKSLVGGVRTRTVVTAGYEECALRQPPLACNDTGARQNVRFAGLAPTRLLWQVVDYESRCQFN